MEHDLQRLGDAVRRRRKVDLRLTVREASQLAKVSVTTWTNVEQGRSVGEDSYLGIDKALGWAAGSHELVLRDEDPIEVPTANAVPEDELLAAVRELTVAVRELRRDLREGRR